MAGLGNNVKMAFLKGLEALGKGASNMADNAHHKLNEINLETRRHELLSEFPVRALDLWQKGAELPNELAAMLQELSELDEQLTLLRAQRYAKVEAPQSEEPEGCEAADEPESAPPEDAPNEGEQIEEAAPQAEAVPTEAQQDTESDPADEND